MQHAAAHSVISDEGRVQGDAVFSWEQERVVMPPRPDKSEELQVVSVHDLKKLSSTSRDLVAREQIVKKLENEREAATSELEKWKHSSTLSKCIPVALSALGAVGLGALSHCFGMGVKEAGALLGAVGIIGGLGALIFYAPLDTSSSSDSPSADGGKVLGGAILGSFWLAKYAFINGGGFLGVGSALGALGGIVGSGFLLRHMLRARDVDIDGDDSIYKSVQKQVIAGDHMEAAARLQHSAEQDNASRYQTLHSAALLKVVAEGMGEPIERVKGVRDFLSAMENSPITKKRRFYCAPQIVALCEILRDESRKLGIEQSAEKEQAKVLLDTITSYWSKKERAKFNPERTVPRKMAVLD